MGARSKPILIAVALGVVVIGGFFLFSSLVEAPSGVPPRPSVEAPAPLPETKAEPSNPASVIDAFTKDTLEEQAAVEGESDADLLDLDNQALNDFSQSYDERSF